MNDEGRVWIPFFPSCKRPDILSFQTEQLVSASFEKGGLELSGRKL